MLIKKLKLADGMKTRMGKKILALIWYRVGAVKKYL